MTGRPNPAPPDTNPMGLEPDFWEKRRAVIKERHERNGPRMRTRRWLNGPYEREQLLYIMRQLTVGSAPHSVRAVPADWLEAIGAHCAPRGYPLHIHADEQPREIEESLAEHGCRPVELLARTGVLSPHATIVHGTHCDDAEIELLATHHASVCVVAPATVVHVLPSGLETTAP